MKWLENNPLGVALAGGCGLIVLVAVALAYIWSRPASSGAPAPDATLQAAGENRQLINELGPITEYREVTARPVFDVTRRPMISVEENGVEIEDGSEEVAGRPDVVLKGVIITPELKMATLKPNSGADTVYAHEGVPLEGDYNGWIISDIRPRRVVLASLEGDSVELELQVNTRKIEEPPKPEPSTTEPDVAAADGKQDAEGDQPLSRAEEIRQRIAERREELRRQAEEQETESSAEPKQISKYQSAIQNMINRKKDDAEEQEKKSDDGSDG